MDSRESTQLKAIAKEYYDATLDGEVDVAKRIFNVMIDSPGVEFKLWRKYCYEYYNAYRKWRRV